MGILNHLSFESKQNIVKALTENIISMGDLNSPVLQKFLTEIINKEIPIHESVKGVDTFYIGNKLITPNEFDTLDKLITAIHALPVSSVTITEKAREPNNESGVML